MRTRIVLLPLLLLALTSPGWGTEPGEEVAFGDDGRLFHILRGSYETLFPGEPNGYAKNSVLALEIRSETGSERLLVPETEGPGLPGKASLIFESTSKRLFIIWESRNEPEASSLNLVSFGDGRFSEVIEVSGNPFPLKGPLHLALVRDPYPLGGARSRLVVHLLWWEEGPLAEEIYYTPVVLVDGEFLGWNPVILLDRFDTHRGSTPTGATDSELFKATTLAAGPDGQSVVVAVPQRLTGRLLTLEIRVLPASLLSVANDARNHFIGVGYKVETTTELAELIRQFIKTRRGRLHAGILDFLADRAHATVLGFGDSFELEEVEAMAQQVWDALLEAGASLGGNGLDGPRENLGCSILHLGPEPMASTSSSHQLEICVVSNRPAPNIPNPRAPVTLLLSEDGRDVLAVWEEEDAKLRYLRSSGQGWTDPRSANLGGAIDVEQAKAYLRLLIRTR